MFYAILAYCCVLLVCTKVVMRVSCLHYPSHVQCLEKSLESQIIFAFLMDTSGNRLVLWRSIMSLHSSFPRYLRKLGQFEFWLNINMLNDTDDGPFNNRIVKVPWPSQVSWYMEQKHIRDSDRLCELFETLIVFLHDATVRICETIFFEFPDRITLYHQIPITNITEMNSTPKH